MMEQIEIGGEVLDTTPIGDIQLYTRVYYETSLFNDLLCVGIGFQRFRVSQEKRTCDTCKYRFLEGWDPPCDSCLGDETDYKDYEEDVHLSREKEGENNG